MNSAYIDIINRFFPTEDFRGVLNILNSDSPSGNLAVYTVINRQYPTIRDCNRTTISVFSGIDTQTNIRISYGIVSVSEASFFFSANGTIDKTGLIKNLFDKLPNFLISFEEAEDEN